MTGVDAMSLYILTERSAIMAIDDIAAGNEQQKDVWWMFSFSPVRRCGLFSLIAGFEQSQISSTRTRTQCDLRFFYENSSHRISPDCAGFVARIDSHFLCCISLFREPTWRSSLEPGFQPNMVGRECLSFWDMPDSLQSALSIVDDLFKIVLHNHVWSAVALAGCRMHCHRYKRAHDNAAMHA